MRKIFTFILLIVLLLNIGLITKASPTNLASSEETINIYRIKMKQDLLCLLLAYPEYITSIEECNGYVYLIMKSGKKLLYDDKIIKNSQEKLEKPDIQDTLEQIYPLSTVTSIMQENFDPGRSRHYGILSEVYGSSKQVVASNLVSVKADHYNFQFNMHNNAAHSLEAVMNALIPLSKRDQNVRRCLFPSSGTFNYRSISGTDRLSPHAFGIAIDLASDKRDYWKWASKEDGEKRLASYPSELVQAFENNGFVWGGKWSHFDILHFEYRPEVILKARYFTNSTASRKSWYHGAPLQQAHVNNTIKKIDELIR